MNVKVSDKKLHVGRQYSGTAVQKAKRIGRRPTKQAYFSDSIQPQVESLCIDWLQLSFLTGLAWGDEKTVSGPFMFTKWQYGSKAWTYIYNVDYEGQPWGIFKCAPRKSNRILKENECHLKLENSVCYTDFRDQVLQFQTHIDGTFSHVARMDIAADGKNILHPLNLCMVGKIHKIGVGGSQMLFNKALITKEGINCTYFRLGSNQSEKYMRVYDKTKELKSSGKKYVENYWKLNGVKDTSKMERLEITLMAKYSRHIFKNDYGCLNANSKSYNLHQILNLLLDKQFMVDVIEKYRTGMYDFRLKDNNEKTRCTSSYNLYYEPTLLWRAIKCLSTVQRAVTDGLYQTKLCIKNLYQASIKTRRKKLGMIAYELAINSHLTNWLQERKQWWTYEVQHRYKNGIPFLDFFSYGRQSDKVSVSPVPLYKNQNSADYIKAMRDHCEIMQLNLQ